MKKQDEGLSRREFAKAAALTTAAVLVPSKVLSQEQKTAPAAAKPPEAPKLSQESQAEADMAYETIMRKYGRRFTDEQKTEIKRLVGQQQSSLDKLRAATVKNSDEPATVFQILISDGHGEGKE